MNGRKSTKPNLLLDDQGVARITRQGKSNVFENLQDETVTLIAHLPSAEGQEGLAAFLEKRAPRWYEE